MRFWLLKKLAGKRYHVSKNIGTVTSTSSGLKIVWFDNGPQAS